MSIKGIVFIAMGALVVAGCAYQPPTEQHSSVESTQRSCQQIQDDLGDIINQPGSRIRSSQMTEPELVELMNQIIVSAELDALLRCLSDS